ncbi:TRAP transporter large permease [Desulfovibrio sp. OttesenSCG-928-C14]|nr:TRAP transporter large permease [Desulfovibrio sp. OttesenSCG-928-C14]
MDPVLIATFLTIFALLALTVPIGISIGVGVIVGMIMGGLPPVFMAQKFFGALDSFPLLAVPFFIMAGEIMQKGTMAQSLLDVARTLVGHKTGGMAHVSVVTSLFYGALSGSAAATTAAVGGIMIPAMERSGYPKPFAAAVNSASGCLGILIPPSIPLIVYGSTAGVSISTLFIATIIPGLLCALALMLLCLFLCRRHGYGEPIQRASARERFNAIWRAKYALLVPIIILGGIYGGIATPTEAGAIAVVYALLAEGLIMRSLSRRKMLEVLKGTVKMNAVIFLVVGSATGLGHIMMYYNLSDTVLSFITGFTDNRYVLLVLVCGILLVLGTFIEAVPIIVIVTPLLVPVLRTFGIDLVHFGVLMTVSFGVAVITPPVGMTLFVGASIANLSIEKLSLALVPFILTIITMLLLIAFIPELSLFLPSTMR